MFKNKVQRYSIRKLTVGAASVLIGMAFLTNSNQAKADNVNEGQNNNDNGTPVDDSHVAASKTPVQNVDHVEVTVNKAATTAQNEKANTSASQQTQTTESKTQTPVTDTNKQENTDSTKDKAADTYSVKINVVNDADATGKNPVQIFDNQPTSKTYGKWISPSINQEFKDGDLVKSIQHFYTIPGYKLITNIDDLTSQFKIENGNLYVNGKNVDLTLHYAPLSDIRVEYVDEATGKVISSADFPTWRLTDTTYASLHGDKKAPIASRYEAAAITIPGYELDSAAIVDGQVGKDVQSKDNPNYTKIIFKYKKTMTNEDAVTTGKGAQIATADGWSDMPLGFKITGVYGNTYRTDNGDVEQKIKDVINHYTNQGYTYVGMTGKPENDDPYNYLYYGTDFYLIPNSPVTVNYVDEQGNKLADSDTIAFNHDNPNQANNGIDKANYWAPKGIWRTKPKEIAGYYLKKVQGAEEGNFTAYHYITTYVYAKNQTPTPQPSNPTTTPTPTPSNPTQPTETVIPHPETPDTPQTPSQPSNDEETVTPHPTDVPEDNETEETIRPHVAVVEKQIVKPATVKSQAELPQTGEDQDNTAAAAGLAMFGIISTIGLVGLKKRKN